MRWQRIPFGFAQGRLSCLALLARRNDKGEEVARRNDNSVMGSTI